ncbi:MAG: response regulator, partial [Planctomycetota bacterium]|nr:response regulator [Planctomycetota bacterium]
PGSLFGLRILVVDDNATNRLILREMLLNWEMRPTAVASADDAVLELRRARDAGIPYQLVLTDVQMPDRDGFDLAQEIKQDRHLQNTIIMMLTSGDGPGDIARCKELGGAAHLMKPIKQSELFDSIAMHSGIADAVVTIESPIPEEAAIRPLRILLAEDSYVNQRLAVGVLTKSGHQLTVANNGVEAVTHSENGTFDLILMDVQMPEMDGYQATAVIRERESRRGGHIPIIAMTASAMKGDREEGLAAGMDGYVSKPIRQAALRQEIEAIVPAAHLEPTLINSASPASNTPGPSSKLDWHAAFDSVGGDPDLLRDIMTTLIDQAESELIQLRQAIENSDTKLTRLAAHTLKGNLLLFGDTKASQIAAEIEELARNDDTQPANGLLPEFVKECRDVMQEIESALANPRRLNALVHRARN